MNVLTDLDAFSSGVGRTHKIVIRFISHYYYFNHNRSFYTTTRDRVQKYFELTNQVSDSGHNHELSVQRDIIITRIEEFIAVLVNVIVTSRLDCSQVFQQGRQLNVRNKR